MISKTKYIYRRFNAHVHFLSIILRKGREFTINTANRCLFRLIELRPGECLFQVFVESSFFGFLTEVQLYLLNKTPCSLGYIVSEHFLISYLPAKEILISGG